MHRIGKSRKVILYRFFRITTGIDSQDNQFIRAQCLSDFFEFHGLIHTRHANMKHAHQNHFALQIAQGMFATGDGIQREIRGGISRLRAGRPGGWVSQKNGDQEYGDKFSHSRPLLGNKTSIFEV